MKKMSAVLILCVGMFGCSATKQATTTGASTNMLAASWTIATTEAGSGTLTTITASFVPNGTAIYDGPSLVGYTSCNLSSLLGTGPVQGPQCFFAVGPGGPSLGSLSVNNPEIGPLELLVGVPTNPVPAGSTVTWWYNEDLQFLGLWTITGTGTMNSNGTVSGTWSCNAQVTPVCAGTSGTFTAVQQ